MANSSAQATIIKVEDDINSPKKKLTTKNSALSEQLELMAYAWGIYGCFAVYGYFQEGIYKSPRFNVLAMTEEQSNEYNAGIIPESVEPEYFSNSLLLTGSQAI